LTEDGCLYDGVYYRRSLFLRDARDYSRSDASRHGPSVEGFRTNAQPVTETPPVAPRIAGQSQTLTMPRVANFHWPDGSVTRHTLTAAPASPADKTGDAP
jgi:hypothetical protein